MKIYIKLIGFIVFLIIHTSLLAQSISGKTEVIAGKIYTYQITPAITTETANANACAYTWGVLSGTKYNESVSKVDIVWSNAGPTSMTYSRAGGAICSPVSSAYLAITVLSPISNNTISGNEQNSNPFTATTIIGSTPTGATGNYRYKWEKSTTSNSSGFSVIPDATSKDYSPGNITTTTYYRRKVIAIDASSNPIIESEVVSGFVAKTVGTPAPLPGGDGPLLGSGSLFFDGSNDRVTVPHNASFDIGTGDFTMEAWVKLENSGGTILSNQTYNGRGFSFQIYADLMLFDSKLETSNGSTRSENNYSLRFPSIVNSWHHVAVTRKSSIISFFLDGNDVVNTNNNFNDINITTTQDLLIGVPSPFRGHMREVRFWNVALTPVQINSYQNVVFFPTPDLIGYWRLNSPSGQTIEDKSILGNNGILGHPGGNAIYNPIRSSRVPSNNFLIVEHNYTENIIEQSCGSLSLSGNITANTGIEAKLRAANEIVITSGAINSYIGPGISLSINPCNTGTGGRISFEEGVSENLNSEDYLTAYPNPSSGKFNLEVTFEEPKQATITIFDMFGKQVYQQLDRTVGNESFEVDLHQYPAGIYIIRLTTDGKVINKKVFLSK